ncbi:MAG: zinc-ribbon domain-containing protein, partial [Methanosarcinales archaeon]|nr:zinc-ribbon domain-containing protein [Methanosarcinales archaeon]
NVTIKDSIIQRSNLLSFCDINGNCTGDVVIEDSSVQRSGIGLDAQIKDNGMPKNNSSVNSCPACEMELPDGAKFCLDCGENLIK